jgi:hypothetical protein
VGLFAGTKFDLLSFAVTPLDILFQGEQVAQGSGFFWRRENKLYLITNWHNVTGRNPFNNSLLNAGGCVPDAVRCWITYRDPISGNTQANRESITLPLYEHYYEPFWFQHKDFKTLRVDVVALNLVARDATRIVTLQDYGYAEIFTQVGHDVFIVGYPLANPEAKMPIWKRGSIATEPLAGWDGKPVFLIDAASRKGMSGSPVFRRVFGPAPLCEASADNLIVQADAVVTTQFAGIYSGHLTETEASVTLGLAWHDNLIEEILANPFAGTRE